MNIGQYSASIAILIAPSLQDAATAQPPAPPTNIRHTDRSTAHLRVEWMDNSHNERGFRVWRSDAGTGDWYLAGETPADTTRFDDGGMQEQTA